ncbi:hypothetical protein ISS37_07630 [candidate division KSB1 bacterium]|nr:hypothetical protein [candidate division KSB1 bacterium]
MKVVGLLLILIVVVGALVFAVRDDTLVIDWRGFLILVGGLIMITPFTFPISEIGKAIGEGIPASAVISRRRQLLAQTIVGMVGDTALLFGVSLTALAGLGLLTSVYTKQAIGAAQFAEVLSILVMAFLLKLLAHWIKGRLAMKKTKEDEIPEWPEPLEVFIAYDKISYIFLAFFIGVVAIAFSRFLPGSISWKSSLIAPIVVLGGGVLATSIEHSFGDITRLVGSIFKKAKALPKEDYLSLARVHQSLHRNVLYIGLLGSLGAAVSVFLFTKEYIMVGRPSMELALGFILWGGLLAIPMKAWEARDVSKLNVLGEAFAPQPRSLDTTVAVIFTGLLLYLFNVLVTMKLLQKVFFGG